MSVCALRPIFLGNSMTSIPFRMMLYVFIGSEPVNGGLHNSVTLYACMHAVNPYDWQLARFTWRCLHLAYHSRSPRTSKNYKILSYTFPVLEHLKSKIENLSSRYIVCRKFAAVCRNTATFWRPTFSIHDPANRREMQKKKGNANDKDKREKKTKEKRRKKERRKGKVSRRRKMEIFALKNRKVNAPWCCPSQLSKPRNLIVKLAAKTACKVVFIMLQSVTLYTSTVNPYNW